MFTLAAIWFLGSNSNTTPQLLPALVATQRNATKPDQQQPKLEIDSLNFGVLLIIYVLREKIPG